MKKIIRATTVPQSLAAFCDGMLKDLSRDYEVVALSSPGPALDMVAQREGVRTVAVEMARHISLLKDLKALFAIIGIFRRERPDMVHSMTPKAGLLCMMAGWLTRVPVRIHTFTGLVFPTSTGLTKQVLMLTDRITCFCATHVIPEGEGVKKDLIDNKITRKDLKVLGYGNVRGVDMDYYSRTSEVEAAAAALRDPSRFTFLFVGRLVGDKGINELVGAFESLKTEYPTIRLFLVGPAEDDLDPVKEETHAIMDSDEALIVTGSKSGVDLLAYYAAADCYVFPSYREGFPNTVLEAGAFGLPSVVTDINGSREIVKDGFNGIVVPPRHQDALAAAMRKMLTDPDARQAMASVARESIASRFERGFVRSKLYEFYKKVL